MKTHLLHAFYLVIALATLIGCNPSSDFSEERATSSAEKIIAGEQIKMGGLLIHMEQDLLVIEHPANIGEILFSLFGVLFIAIAGWLILHSKNKSKSTWILALFFIAIGSLIIWSAALSRENAWHISVDGNKLHIETISTIGRDQTDITFSPGTHQTGSTCYDKGDEDASELFCASFVMTTEQTSSRELICEIPHNTLNKQLPTAEHTIAHLISHMTGLSILHE